MYKEVDYKEVSREIMEQLPKGAFLTVKNGDNVNTMTIAWGAMGFIWNKPIFTVLVRYSRYTHELIHNADEFTVSFPLNGRLDDVLNICGTKSGRDIDKFAECDLKAQKGRVVDTPVISGCDIHLECRIVYRQALAPENLDDGIKNSCYPVGDYHVIYCGEIVAAYRE
jgi:flavin reductase (DIM6/NTAB) family NADH-FMN oxidoreductase RutF